MKFPYCNLFVWVVLGGLAGWLVGCQRHTGGPNESGSSSSGDVVAWVGDQPITVADLKRELAARPPGPSSAESIQRILEEMVNREAILARAREAGFEQEPHVRAQIDRLVGSLWKEQEFARRFAVPPTVTDEEIAAFHQAHQVDFRIPAAIRAGVIHLKVGSHASVERREGVRARAQAMRTLALRANDAVFRQLVQQNSEDQSTRYIGGDTGWIEEGQVTPRWDGAVLEAARAMSRPGDVADVVETTDGFYIVRLLARREATVAPLEEVAPAIRYRLRRQKETGQQAAFHRDLRQGLRIEFNHPLLESLSTSKSDDSVPPPRLPES